MLNSRRASQEFIEVEATMITTLSEDLMAFQENYLMNSENTRYFFGVKKRTFDSSFLHGSHGFATAGIIGGLASATVGIGMQHLRLQLGGIPN